jgi:YD repeat-containing protein
MKWFLAFLLTVAAFGHAVVRPPESTAGQTQQYTLRVPNEKQILTTSIQLTFPAELTITTVDDKAGWKLALTRDAQGRISGATWTGSLAPSADVQFTFTARNPAAPVTVEWKVIQTFEDASRSEWTGPQGSRTPASRTEIQSAAAK